MIVIVLITIFTIVCFFINSIVFKTKINYLNFFEMMFCCIAIFAGTGLYDIYVPKEKTYFILFFAMVCFEIFSLLFLLIKGKSKDKEKKKKELVINRKKTLILSIIVLLFMIPSTIEGIKVINLYGFKEIRRVAFSTEVYSSYTQYFIYYLLSPINKVLLIYAMMDYIKYKKFNFAILICLINCLQQLATFGGRGIILDTITIIFVTMLVYDHKKIIDVIKNNKKVIIVIIALIFVIINVTKDRSIDSNKGVLYDLYSYYAGSLVLMDFHLNNPETSKLDNENLLYGKAMFNPVIELFTIGTNLLRINTDIKLGIISVNEQVQQYFHISPQIVMNNNVTFLYVCLRDFGYFGVVIGPLYIAFLYALVYKKQKIYKNELNKAMYIYSLSILPYFIFEFYISRTPVILTYMFIYILFKILHKEGSYFHEEENKCNNT